MNEPNVAEISKSENALVGRLLTQYRGLAGVYDEFKDSSGAIRPSWSQLYSHFGRLTEGELSRRIAQAERQMDLDGVAFNPYDVDGDVARPWRFDPIPMVLAEAEWQTVALGLSQRAMLADLVLLDLLGPQTLLHERVLPPELLFGNPRYFPACHGLVPRPTRHLNLYAADLARGPSGSWWVTAERTRSPFGLGYILENRLVTSRIAPDAFEACCVQRLAPFFMQLQATLGESANRFRENPRVAIWSRGPQSRAYFEDAFLARYLGYTLVEGDDLAVRDGKVMLKTLGGLLPVEVLFRRVEDHNCDPSELASDSTHGVSGLLEVIRSGNVSVTNSLGSALVESPMLQAFLPQVCRHLLNQDLRIPSVATWWCGHPQSLSHVLENFDKLVIRPAYREKNDVPLIPSHMTSEAKQELRDRIIAAPASFVGQEQIVRSTAPVWDNEVVSPWSLALRTFLVSKGDEYSCLPGALARVSPVPEALLHDMTSGEKSQDVWIVSDKPVDMVSLLNVTSSPILLRRGGSELPSRAADNLFWLGRNIERAEQLARLARCALEQATSQEASAIAIDRLIHACRELKQLQNPQSVGKDPGIVPRSFAIDLVHGLLNIDSPYSLKRVVLAAEQTALKVRDRISIDNIRIISDLRSLFDVDVSIDEVAATDLVTVLDEAIVKLVALSGLAHESMTRTLGWRFLDMGRRIERAYQCAVSIGHFLPLQSNKLDWSRSLEFCLLIHDSYMTYRNRYLARMEMAAVLDLLITDDTNPRSIHYQLRRIIEHVDDLPRSRAMAVKSQEQKLVLSLLNSVQLQDVFELTALDGRGELSDLHKALARLTESLPKLSDAVTAKFLIHAGFQRHYAASPVLPSSSLDQPTTDL